MFWILLATLGAVAYHFINYDAWLDLSLFLSGVVVVWLAQFVHARLQWKRAANALGLEPEAPGPYNLGGRLDDFRVIVQSSAGRGLWSLRSLRDTSIIVYLGDKIPSDFTLLPRAAWRPQLTTGAAAHSSLDGSKRGWAGALLGDLQIDKRVVLNGSRSQILARFDIDTRRLLADNWLNRRGSLTVRDRTIVWQRLRLIRGQQPLEHETRLLVDLGQHLVRAYGRIPAALRDNALDDPNPTVRDHNLRTLLAEFPKTPEAREVAATVIDTDDDRLRLMAIRALGVPAAEVYRELLLASDVHPELRSRAVDHLVEWPDRDWAIDRLDELLAAPASPVRRHALGLVDDLKHEGASPRLLDLVGQVDADEAPVLAVALACVGDPSDERHWIGLLAHPTPELVRRAVLWLGQNGTTRAVGALRAVANRRRDPTLRQTLGNALVSIEGRHGAVRGGRLSIAELEGDAGGLSLSEEGGGLAVIDEE